MCVFCYCTCTMLFMSISVLLPTVNTVVSCEVLRLSVGVYMLVLTMLVGAKRESSFSEYVIVMKLDLKTTF